MKKAEKKPSGVRVQSEFVQNTDIKISRSAVRNALMMSLKGKGVEIPASARLEIYSDAYGAKELHLKWSHKKVSER